MAKQQPEHKVRLGRIEAAIWPNKTKNGTMYNVTVSRTYSADDGPKNSASFGRDDLLVAAKVLDMAHTWICETQRAKK